MANLSWYYYISKYLEFVDTFFFVVRKKFSHISTLHVSTTLSTVQPVKLIFFD